MSLREVDTRVRVQPIHVRAFETDPGIRWLFFFAHPDDELAVAAWMRRLVQAGAHVEARWTHSTPVRVAESMLAAEKIGLPVQASHFGTLPDGNFIGHLNALERWVSEQMEGQPFDRVVVPAYEQGHLDHDSLNFIVNARTQLPVLEFPMYFHYARVLQATNTFANPRGEEILTLEPNEQSWKREILACYPSQTVRRNVEWAEKFARLLRRPSSLFNVERLRFQPKTDFLTPIHEGRARNAILKSKRWETWLRAVSERVV